MSSLLIRWWGSLFLLLSCHIHALEIPNALEDWKGWVLENHPEIRCPFLHNDAQRTCVWPSELSINATNQGASFSQVVETFSDTWVRLPGGTGYWPENIRDTSNHLSSSQLIVREQNGMADIFLPAGNYTLQGNIRWDSMPRTLAIPSNAGIIKLTLNNKLVDNPSIEGENQLWLASIQHQDSTQNQDSLQIRVFRHIDDIIPLRITTRVQMDVSGKERELQLGQLVFEGFNPISFNSPLPARLEKEGKLRVQVKPGTWEIEVQMQSTQPIKSLGYKALDDLWPRQEIWVFAARPSLRNVQLSGAPGIDPQQTQLPGEWRELPAYLLTPDTQLQFEELQRGMGNNANQLILNKEIWLDFDGSGFTLQDKITGSLLQGWRMETLPPYELQSATINGEPQLVTRLTGSNNTGVEIRNRNLNLQTISRLERKVTIPVSGWATDFSEINTQLHLPPGWSLFSATGVNSEYGSWVSQWSLWDIFLVLIISFALAKITQPRWGVLILITLLVTYHRAGAPLFIWLNLVAALALLPLVSGKFKTFLTRYTYLSFFALALILLPFTVQQARQVFYPQQEFADRHIGETYYEDSDGFGIFPSSSTKYAPEPESVSSPAPSYASDAMEEAIMTRSYAVKQKQQLAQEYDPGQQVQAGPAIPNWNWRSIRLSWSGPVKSDEVTSLYLVPPFVNRIGCALSVLLPLLVGFILLQFFSGKTGKPLLPVINPKQVMPALLLVIIGLAPTDQTQAQVLISNNLLKELETRLTQPAKCLPDCASIESVNVIALDNQLTLNMVIYSADTIALPLPAQRQQWWPYQVLVNNKTALLVQNANGELLVGLRQGQNQITLKASLDGRDNLNLSFPLALHNLSSNLQGWQLNGAPTPNQASRSVQLQRIERSASQSKAEHLRPDPVAPFVTVTRQLQLGLEWRVETRVSRIAPATGNINLEIPLLPGESPLGGDIALTGDEATKGKVNIRLDANQNETSWHSVLKAESPLVLTASQTSNWIELWLLDTSPIWNTRVSGITEIQPDDASSLPLWQPWPGESISIDVARPEAVQGNILSIDKVNLNYTPGKRTSNNEFVMKLRTNQAGQYDFALPDGATLDSVSIDNQTTPLQPINGRIKIPLHPGEQEIQIQWQGVESTRFKTITPALNLGNLSSNQMINISFPRDRWPLLVGGPAIGPSVLLWGMLVVILLIAVALGRSNLTPLKSWHWVLLSLGVATVNLYVLALIALWLIILAKRGTLQHTSSKLAFKWMQTGLFILSLVALGSLLSSIPYSLLSAPDMHITGNGSNAWYLRWYQDQSASEFPQAWVISLPLWSYKLAMLLWSLWLASALLKWIPWGWKQLSHHALWYAPTEILPLELNAAITDKQSPNTTK